MSKLRIIDIGNEYGNMNLNAKFYPKYFKTEDIQRDFDLRRERMGEDFGFDGMKMYMAGQKRKDGSFFEITEDYVYEFPEGWTDINEDILVMADDVEGVAVGYPVADCPVVMAYDKAQRVIAVSHCGAELTDKMMPISVIDSLAYTYDSNDEDILVYISSGIDKKSYLYDRYPLWAKDHRVWDGMIEEDKNVIFHIDLKGAIKRELISRNISEENINVSRVDTFTNPDYYSNRAEKLGIEEKMGRNFPCAVFPHEKVLTRQRVRTR